MLLKLLRESRRYSACTVMSKRSLELILSQRNALPRQPRLLALKPQPNKKTPHRRKPPPQTRHSQSQSLCRRNPRLGKLCATPHRQPQKKSALTRLCVHSQCVRLLHLKLVSMSVIHDGWLLGNRTSHPPLLISVLLYCWPFAQCLTNTCRQTSCALATKDYDTLSSFKDEYVIPLSTRCSVWHYLSQHCLINADTCFWVWYVGTLPATVMPASQIARGGRVMSEFL